MNKSIKPEDILSDDESVKIISGVRVRKGTLGAVLANAQILSTATSTDSEKETALSVIRELAPALVVLGVYEHIQWKNPEIQKIVEEAGS
jgi:hypothetical protein